MKNFLFPAISTLLLSGCVTTGLLTPTGGALVKLGTEAGAATSVESATKMGKACSQNILGIVALGDSSIAAAKKAGGITKVASVDADYMTVLYLYGKVCTIVRGE